MGFVLFKTKDGRKILASSPNHLSDDEARKLIDLKFGSGFCDTMISQKECSVAMIDEPHITHS